MTAFDIPEISAIAALCKPDEAALVMITAIDGLSWCVTTAQNARDVAMNVAGGGVDFDPDDVLAVAVVGPDETVTEYVTCDEHGAVTVVREGSYTGFAGGRCTYADLSCGCTTADESADLRAAQ
jgi:hypothetical protein